MYLFRERKIGQEVVEDMVENKKDGKEIPVEFLDEQEKQGSQEMDSTEQDKRRKSDEKIKASRKALQEDFDKKLEEFKNKYEELNDQFLRVRAEFSNYKRRVEREQIEFSDYIKGELIKTFLPIIDDFEQMIQKGIQHNNEDSVFKGAKLIYDKFLQVLKDMGVEKIEAFGQEFDPQVHEALMLQKTEDKDKNGTVIDVFQEGYKLKEKLLRPSKVVVGEYDAEK
jgi:molecular chaperone GrpE